MREGLRIEYRHQLKSIFDHRERILQELLGRPLPARERADRSGTHGD